MARTFNGTSQLGYLTNPSNFVPKAVYTISYNFLSPASYAAEVDTHIINWGGASGLQGNFWLRTETNQLTTFYHLQADDTLKSTQDTGALSTSTLYRFCAVADGSNLTLYKNGSVVGTPAAYSGVKDNSASFDGIGVGARIADEGNAAHSVPNYGAGTLSEIAIWQDTFLVAAEVAALAAGYSPAAVRLKGLVYYWPLIGRTSPETNPKNASNTLTLVDSPTTSPHPRIIVPRPKKTQHGAVTIFYMRPDADDADGSWTTELGGTTLFASIDEPAVDDADYIQSAQTPQNDIARVRISDPTATPDEPFKVRYRYKKTGGDTVDLIVRLKEGTTTRATWTHSNVGTDFTTVTQTLSAGEFATITDFTNLFVEFEADTP